MPPLSFGFFSIIALLGIFILLFFAFILVTKRTNRKANVFLSLFLTSIALSIFHAGLLYNTNLYYFLPHLIKFGNVWLFLFGPLFLFYVRALMNLGFKRKKLQFLHFLPAVLFILARLPIILQSGEYKISYMNKWLDDTIWGGERFFESITGALIAAHFVSYLFFIIHKVKQYQQKIKNSYSSTEKVDLAWIRVSIIIFLIVSVVISVSAIMLFIANIVLNVFFGIVTVCVSFFSCFLAYKGLTQPAMPVLAQEVPANTAPDVKYNSYHLSKEAMAGYYAGLSGIMEKTKIYKNPDLSIQDLATALDIPRTYVSFVLNEYARVNFYDFVNRFRVDEAKRIMIDRNNRNMTVLDIAFMAGFNSKSTFNSYFKKVTRLTPTEFIKGTSKNCCFSKSR